MSQLVDLCPGEKILSLVDQVLKRRVLFQSIIEAAIAEVYDAEELMIIGGASFYEQMIGNAHRLYLTHVDTECEGDVWFPEFDIQDWDVVAESLFSADEKNNFDFRIAEYRRKV